jgi:hypothetical protein
VAIRPDLAQVCSFVDAGGLPIDHHRTIAGNREPSALPTAIDCALRKKPFSSRAFTIEESTAFVCQESLIVCGQDATAGRYQPARQEGRL